MAGPVYPYRPDRDQDCGWWLEYGALDDYHSGFPGHNNDAALRGFVDLLAGVRFVKGPESWG